MVQHLSCFTTVIPNPISVGPIRIVLVSFRFAEHNAISIVSFIIGKKTGRCVAGFWCQLGASSPNPNFNMTTEIRAGLCPPGYYCLEKTIAPIPCENATFNPYPGGKDETACRKCPAGQECKRG